MPCDIITAATEREASRPRFSRARIVGNERSFLARRRSCRSAHARPCSDDRGSCTSISSTKCCLRSVRCGPYQLPHSCRSAQCMCGIALVKAVEDDIEFRRILAAPYANGRQLRDAVDIVVNGQSLALSLDGSPFDLEQLHHDDLPAAWSRTDRQVAILNCVAAMSAVATSSSTSRRMQPPFAGKWKLVHSRSPSAVRSSSGLCTRHWTRSA